MRTTKIAPCRQALLLLPVFLWGLAAARGNMSPVSFRRAALARANPRTTTTLAFAAPVAAAPVLLGYDHAQERVALEALYNATGGAHWTDSPGNGWLKGSCHCRWAGVYCANGAACPDSPVVQLGWNSLENLVGTLPSWNSNSGQGALPKLQVLALSSNPGLSGALPEAYGTMSQMTSLLLYNNSLEGSLPSTYGKLVQMADLELPMNHLDGTLPEAWGSMTKITTLLLYNNYLNVTVVPKSWDKMKKITQLKLIPQLRKVRFCMTLQAYPVLLYLYNSTTTTRIFGVLLRCLP